MSGETLDIEDYVGSGDTIAVGGYLEQNVPVHLLRSIADARIRDLTVVAAPSASLGVDLLVAAGCVSRVVCPYVGFEGRGPAPALQREVGAGRVERELCDQETLVAGLRAAAQGTSCAPVVETGSESVAQSPRVRVVESPFDGSTLTLAAALPIDVAVIHAQAADLSKNLYYWGSPFLDLMFAQASDRTVATVENLIPLRSVPFSGSSMSGVWITAVFERPSGAAPTASHGVYEEATETVAAYLKAEREYPGGGIEVLLQSEGAPT